MLWCQSERIIKLKFFFSLNFKRFARNERMWKTGYPSENKVVRFPYLSVILRLTIGNSAGRHGKFCGKLFLMPLLQCRTKAKNRNDSCMFPLTTRAVQAIDICWLPYYNMRQFQSNGTQDIVCKRTAACIFCVFFGETI